MHWPELKKAHVKNKHASAGASSGRLCLGAKAKPTRCVRAGLFLCLFSQSLKGRIRDLLDVLCANKNSTVLKARLLEAALQFPVRLSDNRLPSLRTLSKLSRGPVKLFSLPNESPVEQAGR